MSCLWQRGFQLLEGGAIRKFQGNFNPFLIRIAPRREKSHPRF
jgi:hypothetical protein